MNKMAKFLKKLREDRGLTQEQLGEIINVSRSLISKWENGNKMPAVECLQALSKFYDITIDEIIFGERKTKENALEIDSLSATIITDSHRKFDLACKAFSGVILILLFIIFGAYFILNYNAYKLYSVGAKGENFDVKNTLMFITKNESYIQFGNITDSDGDDTTYDGYKFYALDGDKKIVLSNREDGDIVRNIDDTDNLGCGAFNAYINEIQEITDVNANYHYVIYDRFSICANPLHSEQTPMLYKFDIKYTERDFVEALTKPDIDEVVG